MRHLDRLVDRRAQSIDRRERRLYQIRGVNDGELGLTRRGIQTHQTHHEQPVFHGPPSSARRPPAPALRPTGARAPPTTAPRMSPDPWPTASRPAPALRGYSPRKTPALWALIPVQT